MSRVQTHASTCVSQKRASIFSHDTRPSPVKKNIAAFIVVKRKEKSLETSSSSMGLFCVTCGFTVSLSLWHVALPFLYLFDMWLYRFSIWHVALLFRDMWLYRFSIHRENKTDAQCYFFNLLIWDAPPLALASVSTRGLTKMIWNGTYF